MAKQKVLIIGSGGREHALAWKVAQSPLLDELFIAPGNGGTEDLGQNVPIGPDDAEKLVRFAKEKKIDLTIVGPDSTSPAGVVDAFNKSGLRIFGPSRAASEIEWSKAFAKDLMNRVGVPTAASRTFEDPTKALEYVKEQELPIVVKASGLALGKGVYICKTVVQAQAAIKEIMVTKLFGESGDKVVIEEYLEGPEASIHALSDGKTSVYFPLSQDHKQVNDNDKGPNTGGMGAYAPAVGMDKVLPSNIQQQTVEPVLAALKAAGKPLVGCLYPGLKLTPEGLKVLEYNARFGDPETQVYMRLLETDLIEIANACIDGKLKDLKIIWRPGYAVCIVTASAGYPGDYKVGRPIYGINQAHEMDGVVVFQAGTKRVNRRLLTSGGRVMGVTAVGTTLEEAIKKAYKAIDKVQFQGMHYRKDIGAKGLKELE